MLARSARPDSCACIKNATSLAAEWSFSAACNARAEQVGCNTLLGGTPSSVPGFEYAPSDFVEVFGTRRNVPGQQFVLRTFVRREWITDDPHVFFEQTCRPPYLRADLF